MKYTLFLAFVLSPFFSPLHAEERIPFAAGEGNLFYSIYDGYIQNWQAFPSASGYLVGREDFLTIEAVTGQIELVVFLASWCLPCQEMIQDLEKISRDFEGKNVRITYIFAHDTSSDALGFLEAYQVKTPAILGTPKILKDFSQPELPSLYLSDKRGWYVLDYKSFKPNDLEKLRKYLNIVTIF